MEIQIKKKLSKYKKRQIRRRMQEIRAEIASIDRSARFMMDWQLEPYEKMAEEYKELEARLKG